MSNERVLGQLLLPLFAGFIFASAAQAEFVTGFEHDPTGLTIPTPTDPNTWVQIPVPAGGETVTFGNNSATFIGGAWVWAAAIDFYRDGLFEWAFAEEITFEKPVNHVDFAFWALRGSDPFNPTVNGGAASGVSVQALNAADQVVASADALPLMFDGQLIGAEGVVNLDGPGIVRVLFNVGPHADPLAGYGIDGLNATTVPVPAAIWMLLACLPALGWRRA